MIKKNPTPTISKQAADSKFQKKIRIEICTGGIVFKKTHAGVRVAFILDPYKKWTFAKGHVEHGEAIEAAAIRETKEEMGLKNVKVIMPLGKIDIWFKDRYRPEMKGVMIHKYVHYFLMEAPRHEFGSPQKDELIGKIIWVSLPQALEISSYDDVKPILKRIIAHFAAKKVEKEGEK